MGLKFKGAWRFEPPENGRYSNKTIPHSAVEDFFAIVKKGATQGRRQQVLEHFKGHLRSNRDTLWGWLDTPAVASLGRQFLRK